MSKLVKMLKNKGYRVLLDFWNGSEKQIRSNKIANQKNKTLQQIILL